MIRPTVSVCIITYNHEAFIGQAIKSVLNQQSNFVVEMVIGEDCSSDNTRTIIEDYQRRFPDKIRLITSPQNVGAHLNLMRTYQSCNGEFIAVLEGDDYWTDPNKLNIQVEALRKNPTVAFAFHDAETFNDSNEKIEWTFGEEFSHILPSAGMAPKLFSQLDFARYGWFVPTASMLIRASSIPPPLPDWFKGVYSGDYTMQLLSTREGPAMYLPRVMSRYRIHQNGLGNVMAQSESKFRRRIFEAKMFQQYVFKPKNKKHADIYLAMQYEGYARFLSSQGRRWEQLKYSGLALLYNWQRIPLYFERRFRAATSVS